MIFNPNRNGPLGIIRFIRIPIKIVRYNHKEPSCRNLVSELPMKQRAAH